MTETPTLSNDAAMVLGLAGTAMPFAGSREEEAERWLRVLRLHGDVSGSLQALGIGEVPIADEGGGDGDAFDHVLRAYGTDRVEVLERVGEQQ